MVVRHSALFRVLHDRARRSAFRQFVYRFLRLGWNAGVLTVGAFTTLGMTSAIVGSTPFDGVSRDAYRLGAFIGLQSHGNGEIYLREGWGADDGRGRWMSDSAALVEIPSTKLPTHDVLVHVEARKNPQLNERDVYLDILANGLLLGRVKVPAMGEDAVTFWLPLPTSVIARHDKTLILCLLAFSDAQDNDGNFESSMVKVDQIYLTDAT